MARVTQAITKPVDASLNDADKQLSVPTGGEWEVLSVLVELISDATVGNRQIELTAVDELGKPALESTDWPAPSGEPHAPVRVRGRAPA
jgi:hypothetical protein